MTTVAAALGALVGLNEPAQRCARQKRDVTRQKDHRVPALPGEPRLRLLKGVRRSQLRFLNDERQHWVDCLSMCARILRRGRRSSVTVDGEIAFRGLEHMLDKRLAGQSDAGLSAA